MPYLTKSNSLAILRGFDTNSIGKSLGGSIYRRDIYFFSKYEKNRLLSVQEMMKNPNGLFEMYTPIIVKDTFTMVYEGNHPAYHRIASCERLTSSYKNFFIPKEIKTQAFEKGGNEKVIEVVAEFRKWFIEHKIDLETDVPKFLMYLFHRWGIDMKPAEIQKENSGIEEKENYDLPQLERKIDEIITKAGQFYNDNPDKQTIIKRFARHSFLAYKFDTIKNNDTNLTDNELKSFLKAYDSNYKKPIFELLVEYYRVKFNPTLSFESNLLERLNFRACRSCFVEETNSFYQSLQQSQIEEIPFPTEEPPFYVEMNFDY
jgi:hypothetical protein